MLNNFLCGAVFFICASVSFASAATADSAPALATPGKQLFEDSFDRAEMAPKWRVGKGFFTVNDNVVSIAENPDDHHGAYAYIKPNFQFKDVVVQFQVKLDGARSCSLMINDTKYKESHAGHILKVTVTPGKLNLSDWKFGLMKNDVYAKMKDPATTAEEKKTLRESIKSTSSDFKLADDASQWNTVQVQIVGDEMLVMVNGKPAGLLKSPGIDHATKNAIGFEVGGKTALVKDMKVWEAEPTKGWSARRDEVLGSLSK